MAASSSTAYQGSAERGTIVLDAASLEWHPRSATLAQPVRFRGRSIFLAFKGDGGIVGDFWCGGERRAGFTLRALDSERHRLLRRFPGSF